MSSENLKTRVRILMATWALLEKHQGRSARMSDIAKHTGISRQALYLHFKTRADLLMATLLYIDEVKGVEARLVASRAAKTGVERLEAFIEAWGNYIPEIYGVSKVFLAVRDTDAAASMAWEDRMRAVREGCQAAARALKKDGKLSPNFTQKKATDILWVLLSVRNWEQLTQECGWSQEDYMKSMKHQARALLVK